MDRKLKQSASLIDLAAMPESVRNRVLWALERAQSDYSLECRMREACRSYSDADLMAFAEREYPERPSGFQLGMTASTAHKKPFSIALRTMRSAGPFSCVAQRGVRVVNNCASKTGRSPNGWAAKVFWRAARIARVTALSHAEFMEKTGAFAKRLAARYPVTRHYWNETRQEGLCWWPETAVIGGQMVWLKILDESRRVKQINRLVKRQSALSKRFSRRRHESPNQSRQEGQDTAPE